MDERSPSEQSGMAGSSWGHGGSGPTVPNYGNAGASTGEIDFKGLSLDDVFSDVFFSPEGELLDIPSDEEEASHDPILPPVPIPDIGGDDAEPNVAGAESGTLVANDRPRITPFPVFDKPPLVKMEESEPGASEAESVSNAAPGETSATGTSAGPVIPSSGASTAKSETVVTAEAGTKGTTTGDEAVQAAGGAKAESKAAGVSPSISSSPDASTAAKAAAAAAAAAAEAANAAAEARAAQEMAKRKAAAAVEAAAAHAQAQARVQLEGLSPQGLAPGTTVRGLTAGVGASITRQLQGMHLDPAASSQLGASGVQWALGLGSVMPPGMPEGGIAGFRPFGTTFGIGQGRPVGGGGHHPSRRQRHKPPSKDLTEEQRTERRLRNRAHAKRSRVRKKFLLDSLQRSVDALQAENDSLQDSIVRSLGDRGRALVAKCVPEEVEGIVTANPKQATKILDDPDYSLVKALQTAQQNFVITDASLPDNPIVFASRGFLALTGYKLSEVLGRNCRFLQGPETDPRAVDKIRKAIEEGSDTSVCLLNYRADMTTFWNQFFVAALRDGEGNTVNYVGVQCKVGDEYARIVVSEQNRQFAGPVGSV